MDEKAKKKANDVVLSAEELVSYSKLLLKGFHSYSNFITAGNKANELVKKFNELNHMMKPDVILTQIGEEVAKLAPHIRIKPKAQGNTYYLTLTHRNSNTFTFMIVVNNDYEVKLHIKQPLVEEHLLIVIKNMIADKFGVEAKEILI